MAEIKLVHQPGGSARLGDVVLDALGSQSWTHLRAAVAFIKVSGIKHISGPLQAFLSQPSSSCSFVIGIDLQGSSLEGVEELLLTLRGAGSSHLFILRNPAGVPSPTFHPKIWYFTDANATRGLLVVGSGNLTEGGLFTNYEVGTAIRLDSDIQNDSEVMADVERLFASWTDVERPHIIEADESQLQLLHDSGELPSERVIRRVARITHTAAAKMGSATDGSPSSGLFRGDQVEPAPAPPPRAILPPSSVRHHARDAIASLRDQPPHKLSSGAEQANAVTSGTFVPQHRVLRMTVRPQQKTELYLTKGVLDQDPAFFGAPFSGLTTPKIASNAAQPQPDPLPAVSLVVYSTTGEVAASQRDHPLKMWTYTEGPSANGDFRITLPSEMLELVPNDSVLVMTRDPEDGLEYELAFYPPGHPDYQDQLARCTETIRNSQRRYGWE